MPFPIDSEAGMVEREAQSLLGTIFAQLLGILRALVMFALNISSRMLTFMGKHPLATMLLITNFVILVA
jgi:hypothetical protein